MLSVLSLEDPLPQGGGWNVGDGLTLPVHQTLTFREKPSMGSFRKQIGRLPGEDQLSYEKDMYPLTAGSGHLSEHLFPPFVLLESTFQCRSRTRMECCRLSPPCRCTTCIFYSPSPSTDTSTSAPTLSPPGT